MTQWKKIHDTLREFLGWHAIDEVILKFVSFSDAIEKLKSSGDLDDELYRILIMNLTGSFNLAMSEVIEANPYIRHLRQEIEQKEFLSYAKRNWKDIVSELVSTTRRANELRRELQSIQARCEHANLPKISEVFGTYRLQCPDCGYIAYRF